VLAKGRVELRPDARDKRNCARFSAGGRMITEIMSDRLFILSYDRARRTPQFSARSGVRMRRADHGPFRGRLVRQRS